ncbi:hypothetical protein BDZ89DRAFT_1111758 [Hymenopellis radicata]|nr:hypothetical protein BDZ89DRAFT_1111758 [Hymenopellis radicata]
MAPMFALMSISHRSNSWRPFRHRHCAAFLASAHYLLDLLPTHFAHLALQVSEDLYNAHHSFRMGDLDAIISSYSSTSTPGCGRLHQDQSSVRNTRHMVTIPDHQCPPRRTQFAWRPFQNVHGINGVATMPHVPRPPRDPQSIYVAAMCRRQGDHHHSPRVHSALADVTHPRSFPAVFADGLSCSTGTRDQWSPLDLSHNPEMEGHDVVIAVRGPSRDGASFGWRRYTRETRFMMMRRDNYDYYYCYGF